MITHHIFEFEDEALKDEVDVKGNWPRAGQLSHVQLNTLYNEILLRFYDNNGGLQNECTYCNYILTRNLNEFVE